jgi:hypothetical protein
LGGRVGCNTLSKNQATPLQPLDKIPRYGIMKAATAKENPRLALKPIR